MLGKTANAPYPDTSTARSKANRRLVPFEMPFRRRSPGASTAKNGAGDGDRTRDIQLGKLAFYR